MAVPVCSRAFRSGYWRAPVWPRLEKLCGGRLEPLRGYCRCWRTGDDCTPDGRCQERCTGTTTKGELVNASRHFRRIAGCLLTRRKPDVAALHGRSLLQARADKLKTEPAIQGFCVRDRWAA